MCFRDLNVSLVKDYVEHLLEFGVPNAFGKWRLFYAFVCIKCHLGLVFLLFQRLPLLLLYMYMFLQVNGTAGEGNNMTVDERKQVAEA